MTAELFNIAGESVVSCRPFANSKIDDILDICGTLNSNGKIKSMCITIVDTNNAFREFTVCNPETSIQLLGALEISKNDLINLLSDCPEELENDR